MGKLYDCDLEEDLTLKMYKGINKLYEYVSVTLGPRGRNVILHKKGLNPIITKDGVTVAEFLELDDPFENAAVQILKQASRKTNIEAGDGTTTSTVLAASIIEKALPHLATGASPIELKRGIDYTVEKIVANIKDMSRPISSEEDIAHIASISANNDKVIGELVARAVTAVGKDGSVIIEKGKSIHTVLDFLDGFHIDSGFCSNAFINNERKQNVIFDDCLVFVADMKIEKVEQIFPILEMVINENKPLIIIATEIEGEALAALITNAQRAMAGVTGSMKLAAMRAPKFGEERREILKDIAIATGGDVASDIGLSIDNFKLENLGSAKKFEIYRRNALVAGPGGTIENLSERIEVLKETMSQSDDLHECERIQDRISRLASGAAIIKVGGATEIEVEEKKARIEDAIEAVKSAQVEGIVAGGGTSLLHASRNLDLSGLSEEQKVGASILLKAIYTPIRRMAENAGLKPDIIEEAVLAMPENEGYDFYNREPCNMLERGIIDPAKVTICALRNAASAASTLLLTGRAIVEK